MGELAASKFNVYRVDLRALVVKYLTTKYSRQKAVSVNVHLH